MKLSGNALLSYAFSIAKDPIRKHMIRNAVTRIHDPRGNHSKVWVKAYWDVYEGLKARDRDATMGALKRVINIKDSAK